MNTYNRNGIQIEQCAGCRGIFLDYGELESLARLESAQYAPPPPPPPAPGYPPPAPQVIHHHTAPAWGAPHHGGHYRQRGMMHMLFSS